MTDNRPVYLKQKEVLSLLRVNPHLLRQRMRQTPEHIQRPWLVVGGSKTRPRYRWSAESVKPWWVAINEYLAAHDD